MCLNCHIPTAKDFVAKYPKNKRLTVYKMVNKDQYSHSPISLYYRYRWNKGLNKSGHYSTDDFRYYVNNLQGVCEKCNMESGLHVYLTKEQAIADAKCLDKHILKLKANVSDLLGINRQQTLATFSKLTIEKEEWVKFKSRKRGVNKL